ncbi:MAG: glycerol-3-phosphate responsive antiterminator [Anaerolineaceae bacterium]|nr:MAG: glycerol-3-phosphate responsive antiterminator [Anaerolineaceae bacterium]
MKELMLAELKKHSIIAAIKNEEDLKASLKSKCQIVFILYGDICNIDKISEEISSADKMAIVHMDLVGGLSSSEVAVQYLVENTKIDGVISTKSSLLKKAHEEGLITVQRVFMIDSKSLNNIQYHINHGYADFIEILPGVLPKAIKTIVSSSDIPVIAGGLVSDEDDVKTILEAGAIAVSTSNNNLWSYNL